jgi:hypothetical protein
LPFGRPFPPSGQAARSFKLGKRYSIPLDEQKPVSEHAPFRAASLRITEMTRVFRARYGTKFPDDDAGRDDLQFMFEQLAWCRDARKRMHNFAELWANWLTPVEFEALARFALAHPPQPYTADQAAARLGLTIAERDGLGLKTIGAIDFDRSQRAQRRKQRNCERERARRERQRAEKRASTFAAGLPAEIYVSRLKSEQEKLARFQNKGLARVWLVVQELRNAKSHSVSEITRKLKHSRMFKALKPEALRKAVHRAFKVLEAHGVVKLEKRPGERGLDALYARLVTALDT